MRSEFYRIPPPCEGRNVPKYARQRGLASPAALTGASGRLNPPHEPLHPAFRYLFHRLGKLLVLLENPIDVLNGEA